MIISCCELTFHGFSSNRSHAMQDPAEFQNNHSEIFIQIFINTYILFWGDHTVLKCIHRGLRLKDSMHFYVEIFGLENGLVYLKICM